MTAIQNIHIHIIFNHDNGGFEWMYQSDRKISNHLSKHRKMFTEEMNRQYDI